MKYRIHSKQDENGGFVVDVTSLPECVSQGRTRQEAKAACFEGLAVYDGPMPPPIAEEFVEVAIFVSCRNFPVPSLSRHIATFSGGAG